MSALIGIVALMVGVGVGYFIRRLCFLAAPATPTERYREDERQVAFLRDWKRDHDLRRRRRNEVHG